MSIFDEFLNLGLIIYVLSFGVFMGSLGKHFTDLRKYMPRLFDEYKQDELSDNLKELDKNLVKTSKYIFFSGFFMAIGLLIPYFAILNN